MEQPEQETPAPVVRNLSLMPSFHKGKAFVFLQLKVTNIADYENDYRPKRQALLEVACGAAKNKFNDLHTIVGIAIDAPMFADRNAEDFILMRCENWTDKHRCHYERAHEGLNFFRSDALVGREVTVTEFPRSE